MIVVKVQGGLGNQMFQYAFGKALANKYDDQVYFDLSSYKGNNNRDLGLTGFNLDIEEISPEGSAKFFSLKNRTLNKLGINSNYNVHFEKGYHYYAINQNSKVNTYYIGYWQSPQHFENIGEEICKKFTLPDSTLPKQYLEKINTKPTIAIHIRRGDYLETGNTQVYHIQPLEYYIEAVNCIENLAPGCQYLVFSDDINWVNDHFDLPVQWEPMINANISDVQMMALMSRCHHQIIANSTYSWWAAWLNQNPAKYVVAPKKWFADGRDTSTLIPENWIKI